MTVLCIDLTEKVWNFRFGTWRGRETGSESSEYDEIWCADADFDPGD